MGRDKKKKPRRQRRQPLATAGLPLADVLRRGVNYSPARILLEGEDLTAAERELLAGWKVQTVDAQDRGSFTSVQEMSAQGSQSIEEICEVLVEMEEAKLLHWDGFRYLMIQPDPES